MKKLVFALLLCVVCFSCKEEKSDAEKKMDKLEELKDLFSNESLLYEDFCINKEYLGTKDDVIAKAAIHNIREKLIFNAITNVFTNGWQFNFDSSFYTKYENLNRDYYNMVNIYFLNENFIKIDEGEIKFYKVINMKDFIVLINENHEYENLKGKILIKNAKAIDFIKALDIKKKPFTTNQVELGYAKTGLQCSIMLTNKSDHDIIVNDFNVTSGQKTYVNDYHYFQTIGKNCRITKHFNIREEEYPYQDFRYIDITIKYKVGNREFTLYK